MQPGFLQKLKAREESSQTRHFTIWEGNKDFFSNDYLGLAQRKSPEVINVHYGSTGSRLLSGHHSLHEQLEKSAAQFFQSQKALLFNSGYDANIGLFSSLPQKGETVLYDQKIHASIRDGVRLSNAQAFSFQHNSLIDLEKKLSKSEGQVFVAIESVYSMDGDQAKVKEIADLCMQYNAYLIIDEAHAVGVFGEYGEGLACQLENQDYIIRVATFGKAFGSHGAVVLGHEKVIQYLMNFARSFIYTTAISVESVCRLISAIEWVRNARDERTNLRNVIAYYTDQIHHIGASTNNSPIQFFPLKDVNWEALSKFFNDKEIAIKPIFPPTVKKGEERLRISLHSYNTKTEVDVLIEGLKRFKND